MSVAARAAFVVALVIAPAAHAKEKFCLTERKLPSMGSLFEVQIVAVCAQPVPTSLFVEMQNKLDRLDAEMSLYQADSPINRLNKTGVLENPSVDFIKVLEISKAAFKTTGGLFDITVLPVLKKIDDSFKQTGQPPSAEELDALKPLVSSDLVLIEQNKIKFAKKGVMITLDGVAKGYAVDVLAEYLEGHKINRYLLNFSGNMRWLGRRADGRAWNIQAWHPELKKMQPLPPSLKGAVATSGVEHNYYSEDKKWHHLIDPRTLRPSKNSRTYTAVGTSAADCDIRSTSGFVK